MRLQVLENGHRPLQKLIFWIMRAATGFVPGPIAFMSYRREWVGKHYAAFTHRAMREAREWTVAEVELFAAFVSKQNECKF